MRAPQVPNACALVEVHRLRAPTPTAKWRGTSCAGADHTFVMQRWTQWLILPRELCSKGFAPSSRIALEPASWRVSS
jgi:hypothetical protein